MGFFWVEFNVVPATSNEREMYMSGVKYMTWRGGGKSASVKHWWTFLALNIYLKPLSKSLCKQLQNSEDVLKLVKLKLYYLVFWLYAWALFHHIESEIEMCWGVMSAPSILSMELWTMQYSRKTQAAYVSKGVIFESSPPIAIALASADETYSLLNIHDFCQESWHVTDVTDKSVWITICYFIWL